MTLAQFRRSESVCATLNQSARDDRSTDLLTQIQARVLGGGIPGVGRAVLDGVFDPELDDLVVLAEAVVARTRVQSAPGPERRAHPRYAPTRPVPVAFAHPELGRASDGMLADIGAGGVRLVAAPNARPVLRWADPVRIVVVHTDETRQAGLGGLQMAGYVARMAGDYTGYLLNLRFDRSEGDWTVVDDWIDRLAASAG